MDDGAAVGTAFSLHRSERDSHIVEHTEDLVVIAEGVVPPGS